MYTSSEPGRTPRQSRVPVLATAKGTRNPPRRAGLLDSKRRNQKVSYIGSSSGPKVDEEMRRAGSARIATDAPRRWDTSAGPSRACRWRLGDDYFLLDDENPRPSGQLALTGDASRDFELVREQAPSRLGSEIRSVSRGCAPRPRDRGRIKRGPPTKLSTRPGRINRPTGRRPGRACGGGGWTRSEEGSEVIPDVGPDVRKRIVWDIERERRRTGCCGTNRR